MWYFWVLLSEKNLKIKKKRLEIHDKIAFFLVGVTR